MTSVFTTKTFTQTLSLMTMLIIAPIGCQDDKRDGPDRQNDKDRDEPNTKAGERLEEKAERLEDRADRLQEKAERRDEQQLENEIDRKENKVEDRVENLGDRIEDKTDKVDDDNR